MAQGSAERQGRTTRSRCSGINAPLRAQSQFVWSVWNTSLDGLVLPHRCDVNCTEYANEEDP
ncbi:hypothetical protein E5D57_010025 [Metarhizium anisopliae]|nr:hypothetical protein E5D57_010025 [Metarhizium anisopliae]